MTFREYIEALINTGFFGKNKVKLGIKLFEVSGTADPKIIPSESAVKKWFVEKRDCSVERYFPGRKIDESGFINYIRSETKYRDALKKLQDSFRSLEPTNSMVEDFRIDLKTGSIEEFYWSLLNQFQRIFGLPESERDIDNRSMPMTPKSERSLEQLRDIFLNAVHHFNVMDIINRHPAILDRTDSTKLNVFLGEMDILVPDRDYHDNALFLSIRVFIEKLQIQVLSLDATLNNRFGIDEEGSINMEEDNDYADDCDGFNPQGLPELSSELVMAADDPLSLLKIANDGWGKFRSEIGFLYQEICLWSAETSDI